MAPAALLLLIAALAGGVTAAAADGPPPLRLPVECRLGETCWVANYMDTGDAQDFLCRPRTYRGHSGTDIAIRDHATTTAVLAAAAGKVIQVRDGEPDGRWLAGQKGEIEATKRQCGNRVAIDHGDGWVTDYCHLRRGSVTVKPGDAVAAGQPIAMVGLSGKTEFPHLHMGLLHFPPGAKQGRTIDPFTGLEQPAGCGQTGSPLWQPPVAAEAGTVYAAGFASRTPSAADIRRDASSPPDLPARSEFTFWAAAFGPASGDELHLVVIGPDGATAGEARSRFDTAQAFSLHALRLPAPPGGWPPGSYRGEASLAHDSVPGRVTRVDIILR